METQGECYQKTVVTRFFDSRRVKVSYDSPDSYLRRSSQTFDLRVINFFLRTKSRRIWKVGYDRSETISRGWRD